MEIDNYSSSACNVCNKKTTGFNYGVQTCNACKMFFRRALDTNQKLKCRNNEHCQIEYLRNEKLCRCCRFLKCLQVGMSASDNSTEVPNIISALAIMDAHRKNTFLNFTVPKETTIEVIFGSRHLSFRQKPFDTVFNFYNWGTMNHITCISFVKKFEFFKFLTHQDFKELLRKTLLKHMILVTAMDSYSAKYGVMCHPGGGDVFPEETYKVGGYGLAFMHSIRSYVVGRLIELKINKEEFLLLSAILICDPGIPNISETAKLLLTKHQNLYRDTLLQYCLTQHSQFGPSRFNEVLSLFHAISKTEKEIEEFSSLFNLCQPKPLQPNLFTQIMKQLVK